MAHTHGDDQTHEPHGGAHGFGWELLDSIMLGCGVIVAILLIEHAYKAWQARHAGVRYDLTPEGRAATDGPPVPLVDLDALREHVEKGQEG